MNDELTLWEPQEMTIPEVRERLFELAEDLQLPELSRLAQQLFRRKNQKLTKARHRTPDRATQQEIRDYHEAHPDLGMFEIGIHFNVNQARVSEAIYGKRGERGGSARVRAAPRPSRAGVRRPATARTSAATAPAMPQCGCIGSARPSPSDRAA